MLRKVFLLEVAELAYLQKSYQYVFYLRALRIQRLRASLVTQSRLANFTQVASMTG